MMFNSATTLILTLLTLTTAKGIPCPENKCAPGSLCNEDGFCATSAIEVSERLLKQKRQIPDIARRRCGPEMGPCPKSQYCEPDLDCSSFGSCAGICKLRPIRAEYPSCGGYRPANIPDNCRPPNVCIDDPYRGGCGMACDAPGICVKPVFCGGFAGIKCKDGLKCVRDPRNTSCDPRAGGADCGGICA